MACVLQNNAEADAEILWVLILQLTETKETKKPAKK
jgi:hypothetical protein